MPKLRISAGEMERGGAGMTNPRKGQGPRHWFDVLQERIVQAAAFSCVFARLIVDEQAAGRDGTEGDFVAYVTEESFSISHEAVTAWKRCKNA